MKTIFYLAKQTFQLVISAVAAIQLLYCFISFPTYYAFPFRSSNYYSILSFIQTSHSLNYSLKTMPARCSVLYARTANSYVRKFVRNAQHRDFLRSVTSHDLVTSYVGDFSRSQVALSILLSLTLDSFHPWFLSIFLSVIHHSWSIFFFVSILTNNPALNNTTSFTQVLFKVFFLHLIF